MSEDDKPKPVDDLKEGLGLLFRAAKGAVAHIPTDKIEGAAKGAVKEVSKAFESLPTEKIEGVAKDAVKEVGRAFESLGNEIDRVMGKSGSQPAPPPAATEVSPQDANAAPPVDAPKYDDGYAPEPPKGPRVG